jgi:hypothetical protein
MKLSLWLFPCLAAVLLAAPAQGSTISSCTAPAGGISCTGTLATPEDVFLETFTVAADTAVTVQTYSFGGGTNLAGSVIPSGGFDPLVALFSGTQTAATILPDGGNPVASADSLTLFSAGCPPAGTITIGATSGVCGDNRLSATLAAGTYTLLLSDANFIALAVDPSLITGPYDLTDTTSNNYGSSTGNGAYTDLSFGAFQTCDALDCNTDSANFAVDILTSPANPPPAPVPEPLTLPLVGLGLVLLLRQLGIKARSTNCSSGN